ncbi:MAG TPA: flagellar basal-body MS-ring/collar protein FliF [Euzebyales bacterium]|nr:flagellar basal-body MS-ring/collar protein FliF [Euzebyales bacterium]
MDLRDRVVSFVRNLPVAHRVVIVAAVAGTALAGFAFFSWVTSPAYTLLYADLDDVRLQQVIEGLESEGVPYKIEAGGSRVLVPSDQLYETRASLAAEGIEGGAVEPPGYELLDEQGVGVSNFKQRVDYQRALEGELSATLTAMDSVETANVRLVIPEEELFEEEQKPVTASVLLDTARELDPAEVETVAFMVSSSVEGLEASNVTVANTDGTVLQAPGDAGGSAVTSRIMRQTREFEQMLAEDVRQLVATAGGGEASVVVRASMNYDEAESTSETYNPDTQVSLREDTEAETFTGEGAVPGGAGGTAGVDGGPAAGGNGTNSDYERDRSTVEYGVDRETTVTRRSPGTVDRLSVAIVMDDGALTGTTPPAVGEVEQLVAAALGLDEARGDTVAVSAVPFPAAEEAPAEAETGDVVDLAARIGAVVVLLAIAVIFILMLRRRRRDVKVIDITRDPASSPVELVDAPQALTESAATSPEPLTSVASIKADVAQLVEEQPEDIAVLLRGWLADRRT